VSALNRASRAQSTALNSGGFNMFFIGICLACIALVLSDINNKMGGAQ
jgi:hypothetical protein